MTSDELDPIFLVTAGRSGSTLLRLILNDHPEVGCPGESGLPSLIAQYVRVWHTIASDVERAHVDVMSAEVRASIRAAVGEPMRYYLQTEGKRVFCDKSLETAQHLEVILDVFPRARFLLLFRHVMDVVASGIEASPWGFGAFGYARYVSRSVGNFVSPLVEHWVDHVESVLSWEREHPAVCHRVRYEDLVQDPEAILDEVWGFLGVSAEYRPGPGVFERARDTRTWGDMKVAFTDHIHTKSIGTGRRVPAELVRPVVLDRANTCLAQLAYEQIGSDWNGTPPSRVAVTAETRLAGGALMSLMDQVASVTLRESGGRGPDRLASFAVVADDWPGLRWVVGPDGAQIDRDGEVSATLSGAAEDLLGAITGDLNAGILLRERRLRVRDHAQRQGPPSDFGVILSQIIAHLRRPISIPH